MRVKKWALMGILCGTMVLLAGCGKAQKAYKQAVALAESGSYEKAAASFKEAIAENKDKAEYPHQSPLLYSHANLHCLALIIIYYYPNACSSSRNSIFSYSSAGIGFA